MNKDIPFYVFITGELKVVSLGNGDEEVFTDINCEMSGNIPDEDALIILANSMKSILSKSEEEVDLEEVFRALK